MLATRVCVLGVLLVIGSSVGVVTTQRVLERPYDRELEVLDDQLAEAKRDSAVDKEASARLVRELVELDDRIRRARSDDPGCHYMPERERQAAIAKLRELKREQAIVRERLERARTRARPMWCEHQKCPP
jgi:hypothetical protein